MRAPILAVLVLLLAALSATAQDLPCTAAAPSAPLLFDAPGGVIFTADLDGDGNLDVVSYGSGLTVAYGRGDGTFERPQRVTTGYVNAARAADLHGDGRVDLVTVTDAGLTLHANEGRRTFGPAKVLREVSRYTTIAGVGDIAGDDRVDLVTTEYSELQTVTPQTLINEGGTFSSVLSPGQDSSIRGVADLDGDGLLDLLTTSIDLRPVFRRGDGSGAFGPALGISTDTTYRVALGDVNGDGLEDVIGASTFHQKLQVVLSPITPSSKPMFFPSFGAESPAGVADFNNDGRPDIFTYAYRGGGIQGRVHLNDGASQFVTTEALTTPPLSLSYAVADVDHDGVPDLLTRTSTYQFPEEEMFFAVLRGRGDGTFLMPSVRLPRDSKLIGTIDLEGDGVDEILVRRERLVLLGKERADRLGYDFELTSAQLAPSESMFFEGETLIGDYNVVVANLSASPGRELVSTDGTKVFAHERQAGGGWKASVLFEAANVTSIAAGDFDEKAAFDEIAFVTHSWPTVTLQIASKDGRTLFRIDLPWSSYFGLRPADVDGDGNLDLFVTATGSWHYEPTPVHGYVADYNGAVRLLRGRGDGSFEPLRDLVTGALQIFDMSAGDLNGDGLTDFVVTALSDQEVKTVTTYTMTAGGTTDEVVLVRDEPSWSPSYASHDIADLNLDGVNDLVLRSVDDNTLSIFYGTRSGLRQTTLSYGTGVPHVLRRRGSMPAVAFHTFFGEAGLLENGCRIVPRRRASRR